MINRDELFALPAEEKKQLAADLLNSIDEEIIRNIPDWKKELIEERLQYHEENNGKGISWQELKEKYKS